WLTVGAIDRACRSRNTWSTVGNKKATTRPQACNDAVEVRMGRRRPASSDNYLVEALGLLGGWHRNGSEINRTLQLDEAQHAALTERIKVFADALQVRAQVRRGVGHTLINLDSGSGELSAGEVNLAARIEDAYRAIAGVS